MFRAPAFVAALAICGVLIGGAVWLRASLAAAFDRGELHGRALAAAAAAAAFATQQSALDLVRGEADRQAAALESENDALREKLDELEKLLTVDRGASPCLDAGVVRALDAIRGPGAGAGAP